MSPASAGHSRAVPGGSPTFGNITRDAAEAPLDIAGAPRAIGGESLGIAGESRAMTGASRVMGLITRDRRVHPLASAGDTH
ncbi:MAG: hypothetical protein ABL962_03120 [Fimbriimonadaceae bacterium]